MSTIYRTVYTVCASFEVEAESARAAESFIASLASADETGGTAALQVHVVASRQESVDGPTS